MKLIITEQQFEKLININELRSNPETNKDPDFVEYFNNIISKYNTNDIYISFRTDIHVTDVNRNNKYNTPTGFYTYPLKSFIEEIYQLKAENNFTEETFRKLFPFNNNLKYIHFFILNSHEGVLNQNTSKYKLNGYAEKIKDMFITQANMYDDIFDKLHNKKIQYEKLKNQEKDLSQEDYNLAINIRKEIDILNVEKNKSVRYGYVCETCNKFINNTFKPIGFYEPKHDTHKFWLLLYDIVTQLIGISYDDTNIKVTTLINTLCRKIGINGFEDSEGIGYIHTAEKQQAVFFKVKNIGNLYVYSPSKGDDLTNINYDDFSKIIYNFKSLNDSGKLFMLKKMIQEQKDDLLIELYNNLGFSGIIIYMLKLINTKYIKMIPPKFYNELKLYAKISIDKIKYTFEQLLKREDSLLSGHIKHIYNTLNDHKLIDDNNNIIDNQEALRIIMYIITPNISAIKTLPRPIKLIKYMNYYEYINIMGDYAKLFDDDDNLKIDMVNDTLKKILTNFQKKIKL